MTYEICSRCADEARGFMRCDDNPALKIVDEQSCTFWAHKELRKCQDPSPDSGKQGRLGIGPID